MMKPPTACLQAKQAGVRSLRPLGRPLGRLLGRSLGRPLGRPLSLQPLLPLM